MKEFKYKTSFSSQIRCLVDAERDKFLAKASLENLKSIIPDGVKDQIDLLAIAFNSCTPNLGNKNMDMIDNKIALDIYQSFINRPINIEHSRTVPVGHIVSASFSEFNGDYAVGNGSKVITASDVKAKKEPFNIALSAVLYRLYNHDIVEEIEASANPNSDKYMAYSTSWELAFDTFVLAVGSQYLEDCEIVKDEAKIAELLKYTLSEGGTGNTPEGKPIYRLITGEVYPLGIGITESPAAFVAGITTDSKNTKITVKSSKTSMICPECGEPMDAEDDMEDSQELTCGKCKKSNAGKKWKNGKDKEVKEETKSSDKKIENSNSQSETDVVNQAKDINKFNKIMDIKTRKDITDESLKEVKASQVLSVIDSEINKISEEWEQKKNATDKELKASNEKAAELEKQYKEGQEKLSKVEEDLQKLVKANADREQEEVFNTRMNYFDTEYDLADEKIRNIVARKIKGANEDQYKEAKEEIELLLAAKKKGGKKVFDKKTMKWVDPDEVEDKEKKQAKASTEKTEDANVEDAIDKGDKTKTTVAATTAPTETETEKWAKAFGEDGWEVDKRAFRR